MVEGTGLSAILWLDGVMYFPIGRLYNYFAISKHMVTIRIDLLRPQESGIYLL